MATTGFMPLSAAVADEALQRAGLYPTVKRPYSEPMRAK